jgi:2-methylisocitrate lyase-like PEP mutase family enzyme
MTSLAERHQKFFDLHQSGCFIMPNPWDRGSARLMAALGAQALGTSSAAYAFTLGLPDMGSVSRDDSLAHAAHLIAATDLPVSGDLEDGFGEAPDQVALTVRLAAEAGLSGCSIEDNFAAPDGVQAYDFALSVERVRAGASATRALGRPFVFCARADGVMNDVYDLAEGVRRLLAFEAAGADLLYLPMPPGLDELKKVLASVKKPVNALAAGALRQFKPSDFAALGVRRISLGSQIARVTHAAMIGSLKGMFSADDFSSLNASASSSLIDSLLMHGARKA